MNNELAGLPEEVRWAIHRLYRNIDEELCGDIQDGTLQDLDKVRAELLRLARDNAVLRHLPERICELRDAESERDALRKRIDESRHVTIGAYPAHGFGYVQMICDPAKGISDKVYALVPLDDAEAAP